MAPPPPAPPAGERVYAAVRCVFNSLFGRATEAAGWVAGDLVAGVGTLCLLVAVSLPAQGVLGRLLSARLLVWIGSFS